MGDKTGIRLHVAGKEFLFAGGEVVPRFDAVVARLCLATTGVK